MTADYIREVKHLKVTLDDGTVHTYFNVESPAADAFFSAPSMEHHFQKYIEKIYIRINPQEPTCPR